jgi:hypothetical protein
MAKCVTCGKQLHPERAEKYNYCTDRECQKRNAKGLTILAMGVNKAQDQYEVLNERTRDRVASGRYVEEVTTGTGTGTGGDQDRTDAPADRPKRPSSPSSDRSRAAGPPKAPRPRRPRWTKAQEDLALIYNSRGVRPDEIAKTLGLDTYTVTQMILAGRNRAKP